jgi:2-C-methyl-D-erythritol 4-phosphate cytidylyltransferase
VQTPQGFRVDVLRTAHQQADGTSATDDASLVEASGCEIVAVPGADEAFKITTAADLARAEFVLGGIS